MSDLPYDEHFEQLAAGYFDEVLDEAGQAELKAQLQADDRRVKRFAELAQLNQMISSEIAYEQEAERFGLSVSPGEDASTSALAELASLYEGGLQDPMNFSAWREEKASKAAAELRKARLTRTLVGSSVAAALVIAVALLTIVFTGGAPQTPIADNSPTKPADLAQPIPRGFDTQTSPVATLTSTHNAQWDSQPAEDLRRGSDLHAGDRLTLTAGFAEITTHRGAVAILEAPTTVELLNNNNAIRLHTGKLVGICETESSQGFLIRTPHMDITDLGTRFGVDATQHEATEVHVYEGEVEVARPNPSAPGQLVTQRLIQGQAVQAAEETPTFVAIEPAYDRFASGVGVYQLPGTGYQIDRTDGVDPEWNLIEVDGQRLENKVHLALGTPPGLSTLTPNDPNGSRWLEVNNAEQYQGDQEAIYTIETLFIVPKDVDIETAVLRIDFHADDRLEGIAFSGRPYAKWRDIEQPANGKGTALIPLRDILIAKGINGVHVRIKNAPNTKLFLNIAWQIEYPAND